MVNTYRNVEVTIGGESDQDIRDQVKAHFGLVEPSPPQLQKVYTIGKLDLVKLLRKFDSKYSGLYNTYTGNYDGNKVGLMDTKKFVEESLGEPS